MSALDDLRNKKVNTQVELCILYWGDPVSASDENIEEAERAAAELADKDAELLALRERVAWWLDNYDITMPCGHKNRYLLTDGRGELVKDNRGDCVCVMCQLEVADEIDAALKSQ